MCVAGIKRFKKDKILKNVDLNKIHMNDMTQFILRVAVALIIMYKTVHGEGSRKEYSVNINDVFMDWILLEMTSTPKLIYRFNPIPVKT